jgi:hypothetical protein
LDIDSVINNTKNISMHDIISKKFSSTTNSIFNKMSKDSLNVFDENNIKSPKLNLKNHFLNSNSITKKLNFKNIKNYSSINYSKKRIDNES